MAGQMLRRSGPAAAPAEAGCSTVSPSEAMSATGTTTSTSSSLRAPESTTVTGRGTGDPPGSASRPPRKRAISSRGLWVAESAMRCGELSHNSSSRSSDTIRWTPRLLAATAWISSTITCSTPVSVWRAWLVSIRNNDSGVVIKMFGGCRTSRRRSSAEVSPVRTPTVGTRTVVPRRSAARRMPCSGARRFFSTSTASARNGDTYSTRVPGPDGPGPDGAGPDGAGPDGAGPDGAGPAAGSAARPDGAGPADMSRSMAHRKAARVLPVPVGAHTSVWSPAAMAGQPSTWGGVGSENADANQARVGSEKAASGPADGSASGPAIGPADGSASGPAIGPADGSATTPPPYPPPATPTRQPRIAIATVLDAVDLIRAAQLRQERSRPPEMPLCPPTVARPPLQCKP